jgi:multiple sugar transport system permease protein
MIHKDRTYIAFMSPAVVILIILTVVPVLLLFTFSATSWTLLRQGSFQFFGFGNFRRLAAAPRAVNSIKVSFYYIIVNTAIQMFIGFIIAYLLYKAKKGTRLLRPVLLVPMLIPPVVVGLSWRVLFTPDLGGINYLLELIRIQAPDWLSYPATAIIAVTIASVWQWTPFVMLVLLAGLESLPTDSIEAAVIDGASQLQLIRMVIIPLMQPVIMVTVILRIIEALGILPVIYMMTGGGPAQATESINVYAYEVGFSFLDISYASSLLVVFVFIVLIFSSPFIYSTIKGRR